MTALEAIAVREARIQYDTARRQHDLNALSDSKANRPLMALKEAAAAMRLRRYAAGELVTIRDIG